MGNFHPRGDPWETYCNLCDYILSTAWRHPHKNKKYVLHKNADYSYDDFSQLFRYVVVQKDVRPCVESLNVQMHPKYRSFAAVDGKAIGKLSFIIALDTLNDNGKNKLYINLDLLPRIIRLFGGFGIYWESDG